MTLTGNPRPKSNLIILPTHGYTGLFLTLRAAPSA